MKISLIAIQTILVLIITALIGSIFYDTEEEKTKEELEFEEILNQTYIVEEDTLFIIDYSLITGEYLMSDYKIYHHLIIENSKTIDHRYYKNSVNGDAIPAWLNPKN